MDFKFVNCFPSGVHEYFDYCIKGNLPVGDAAHVVRRAGPCPRGRGLLVDGGPVEVPGIAAENREGGRRVGRRQPAERGVQCRL